MAEGRLKASIIPEETCEAGIEYVLLASFSDEPVRTYVDGSARLRYPFVISSVDDYGLDAAQDIAKTGFAETLAEWLRKQARLRNLPELPAGLTARNIKTLGSGHQEKPDTGAGKYQIHCELEYYRKSDF